MLNSSDFNINKVCRTCLTIGEMKSLYEKTATELSLAEMLMSCTTVEYYGNDGLPNQICTDCACEINRSYKFATKCREADDKLQVHLRQYQKSELKIELDSVSNIIVDDSSDEISITQSISNIDNSSTADEINNEVSFDMEFCKNEIINQDFTKIEIDDSEYNVFDSEIDLSGESNDNSWLLSTQTNSASPDTPYLDIESDQNQDMVCVKQEISDDIDTLLINSDSMDVSDLKIEFKTERVTSMIDSFEINLLSPVVDYKEENESFREQSPVLSIPDSQSKIVTEPNEPDIPLKFLNSIVVLERLDLESIINNSNLRLNSPDSIETKQFQCKFCVKSYARKSNLTSHYYKKHPKELPIRALKEQLGNKYHSCEICDKRFKWKSDLMRHYPKHSRLTCSFCKLKFTKIKHLNLHLLKCKSKLQCKQCEKAFDNNSSLQMHMLRVHFKYEPRMEKSFVCTVCKKSFPARSKLVRHMPVHIKKSPFSCSICQKKYKRVTDVNRHMLRIHDQKHVFSCKMCHHRFNNKPSLNKHIETHKQELKQTKSRKRNPLFSCRVCAIHFTNKRLLTKHIQEMHSLAIKNEQSNSQTSNIQTQLKNEVFSTESSSEKYSRKVDIEESYTFRKRVPRQQSYHELTDVDSDSNSDCESSNDEKKPKIDSTPANNDELNQISNQTSNTHFECTTCSKKFNSYSDLISHTKLHLGNKFSCANCGKNFARKCNLSFHMRLHTDTLFSCSLCPKMFITEYYLNLHLNAHARRNNLLKCKKNLDIELPTSKNKAQLELTVQNINLIKLNAKTFQCSVCRKKFLTKGRCLNHMRLHSIMKHFCRICNKSFTYLNSLRSHVKNHYRKPNENLESITSDNVESLESPYVDAFTSKNIKDLNSEHVESLESSHVEVCTSENVQDLNSKDVASIESPHVEAFTSKNVKDLKSKHVESSESPHVEALESSHVEALESTYVEALEPPHVEAVESPHIEALESTRVEALQSKNVTTSKSEDVESLISPKTEPDLPVGKRHKCGMCKHPFRKIDDLEAHMKVHSSANPFTCTFCGEIFDELTGLKLHMHMHDEERQYACSYCSQKFIYKNNLRRHELLHSYAQRFECDMCTLSFIHKFRLIWHQKMHFSGPIYQCTKCPESFDVGVKYEEHMKTHKMNSPYSCTLCDIPYYNQQSFKNHMLTHCESSVHSEETNQNVLLHSDNIFTCKICDQTFKTKAEFYAHTQHVHIKV